jgi:Flp pilus assembly protein TadG
VRAHERGQAAVELLGVGTLLAVLALGAVDLLRVVAAEDRAQRVADQAAVLAAERRPIPDALRRDGSVVVSARAVEVTVHVCAVTSGVGCFDVRARARLP